MKLALQILGVFGLAVALFVSLAPFVLNIILNWYDRSISGPTEIVSSGVKVLGPTIPTILISAAVGAFALALSFRLRARQ